jgi:hypothetical protein
MQIALKKRMYGPDNAVDARALTALLELNTLITERWEPEGLGGLDEGDFAHAVDAGLLFRPNRVVLDHDAAVDDLCRAIETGTAERHAAMFLASLSTQRRDYRAALPAFAIAHRFEKHPFKPRADGPYCAVCGMTTDKNSLARSESNANRFKVGGIIDTKPLDLAFYLHCAAQLEPVEPTDEDRRIFGDILKVIEAAEPDDTLKTGILKATKKALGKKVTTEEAKAFLETLGYCGILETPEHPGFLERYVNPGYMPRKTHSSDWRYPADFWLGKDGIQREALTFWFGRSR